MNFLEVSMKNSNYVKNVLLEEINKLNENRNEFLKNPGKDFSKIRKLDFSTMLKLILSMETGSLKDELYRYFDFLPSTASVSAFVQQRSKILYTAFEHLFRSFNDRFEDYKLYKGYRLLAIDGSTIPISYDKDDSSTFMSNGIRAKGSNSIHLNAQYDLLTHIYTDIVVQPNAKMNEHEAFVSMINRYSNKHKAIFIADRGFESFNSFEYVNKSGNKYLIRIKDIDSNGILSNLVLPQTPEFDADVHLVLTNKQTNEIKANKHLYKFLSTSSKFDFVDKKNPFYEIDFRVVRIKASEDTYECIATNLGRESFSINEIKELYNLRWGIETSFRELKYSVGMNSFHCKKREFIYQEIYARIILYNFSERIIQKTIIKKNKKRKYAYQINFTRAFHICRYFLRFRGRRRPLDVESLISGELLPIRPDRTFERNLKPKQYVYFVYR